MELQVTTLDGKADGSPNVRWSSSIKRLWWCRPCETTWVD